ncbi:MAG: hypothetical protein C0612_07140 [Desulfobulbaceae bacterium]|jgi:hypothetical protein|nr:MAG: hypothetical protein C0612_07140 [Desulfobulbaceae bacterium]
MIKEWKMKKILIGVALMMTVIMVLLVVAVSAVEAPRMKMTTEIPKSITTPDRVETRIGSLEFFDGFPTEDTAQKCFDNLDFLRGVETFLNGCPAASLIAMREGMRKLGAIDGTIAITETLMDSKSLFLTPNTESIYTGTWLDLKDGPIVVESPPNTLGIVNDFWFRYVADLGNAGPDKGKGGKYLFVGPGYEGDIPEGYFVSRSQTYGNFLIWRGFLVEGDPKPGIENFKKHARIYPLSRVNDPPEQKWVNMSGKAFNTIHANDFSFYEELNQVVQEEPTESQDPEILGLFASIGIKKGQPFTPDARMKKILTEAAAVGNATVRSLTFPGRDKTAYQYNSGYWKTAFIGGSHEFLADGVRLLDARAFFYYYATMVTPAMTVKIPGAGSQYSMATVDAKGNPLDGSKKYKLHYPPDVPAKDFWSVVVYDNQTRSLLQTDQQYPSVVSQRGVQANLDGSYDIYFGPKVPEGKESNWIQTIPEKGFSVILRFYGPLQAWFDQTWRPGDIELQQ